MFACIYTWLYICRYICDHMWDCMCMQVFTWVSISMHVCMSCACVPSLLPYHLTYIDVTQQIWLPHCKYESNSNYGECAYRPNILLMCARTQPTAISTSHITANNKYAHKMLYFQVTQCASIMQVGQYVCNILTHWNQPHAVWCCTQKAIVVKLTIMTMQLDCIS